MKIKIKKETTIKIEATLTGTAAKNLFLLITHMRLRECLPEPDSLDRLWEELNPLCLLSDGEFELFDKKLEEKFCDE